MNSLAVRNSDSINSLAIRSRNSFKLADLNQRAKIKIPSTVSLIQERCSTKGVQNQNWSQRNSTRAMRICEYIPKLDFDQTDGAEVKFDIISGQDNPKLIRKQHASLKQNTKRRSFVQAFQQMNEPFQQRNLIRSKNQISDLIIPNKKTIAQAKQHLLQRKKKNSLENVKQKSTRHVQSIKQLTTKSQQAAKLSQQSKKFIQNIKFEIPKAKKRRNLEINGANVPTQTVLSSPTLTNMHLQKKFSLQTLTSQIEDFNLPRQDY